MKKNIFIFGGNRGIGKVFIEKIINQNYEITAFSRKGMDVNGVDSVKVDFTDTNSFVKAITSVAKKKQFINHLVFFQRYRGEDSWNLELLITLEIIKIAIDNLTNFLSENASIVLIGSSGGRFVATEQPIEYGIAKAGLEQLARYYAIKLGSKGVRINVVSPTVIIKPENSHFYAINNNLREMHEKATPLGRMSQAEDVCEVIIFLLNVSFVTGQVIIVDGGLSLQTHEGLAKKISGILDSNLIHPK